MTVMQEMRTRWPDLRLESQGAVTYGPDGVSTSLKYKFFTEMAVTQGDAFSKDIDRVTFTLSVTQREGSAPNKSKAIVSDADLETFLSMDLMSEAAAAAAPPILSPSEIVNAAIKRIEQSLGAMIEERQEAERQHRSLVAKIQEAAANASSTAAMGEEADDPPPLLPQPPGPMPGGYLCALSYFAPVPSDPEQRRKFVICAEKVIRAMGDRVSKATHSDRTRAEAIATAADMMPTDIMAVHAYLTQLASVSSITDLVELERQPLSPRKRPRHHVDTDDDDVTVISHGPSWARVCGKVVPKGGHLDPAFQQPPTTASKPPPQRASKTTPAPTKKRSLKKSAKSRR